MADFAQVLSSMERELILNMATRKEKVRDGNYTPATELTACFTASVAAILKDPLTWLTAL